MTLACLEQENTELQEDSRHASVSVSVVIPTFRREQVLVDTIAYLLQQDPAPNAILVVDQSPTHEAQVEAALEMWGREGRIAWIRLAVPSITHAMNIGLQEARSEVVLFLDDDIIPGNELILAHARAHLEHGCSIVAGQVLQPGESVFDEETDAGDSNAAVAQDFRFSSNRRRWIDEIMGGNFSVKRDLALRLGGFDENFVHVAYRFEAEFCDRAISAGERILFEPRAGIRHLKINTGGTRSFGIHLTTVKPSHTVGAYYYFLRARRLKNRFIQIMARPLRAVRTRHHLRKPWWIPVTLIAEAGGFIWAVALFLRGPRLLSRGERDSGGTGASG